MAGSGGVAIVILLLVGFVKNDSADSTTPGERAVASASNPRIDEPASEYPPSGMAGTSTSRTPEESLVAVMDSLEPPAVDSPPKIARNFDEVANAIVKLEMPLPDGRTITGTGFIIDHRGWVATNHHVASMASTAARVKMYDGRKVEIEGIIALAPERDLAIVKLGKLPPGALLLDIGYQDLPRVRMRVYAYGHPLNNEFSLVEGIVSRVLTTRQLDDQQPEGSNALAKLHAPPDQLWIQTDATVSQGNSGGPLLDEKCRVIGVNTFANLSARFGFASHVKYLKSLADRASGEVTPLKPLSEITPPKSHRSGSRRSEPREVTITRDKLQRTFDAAAAFDWAPDDRRDYGVLEDLALMFTFCKEPNAKVPFELSDLADRLFAKMKMISWRDEQLRAINRQGVGRLSTPGHGAVFVGTVVKLAKIKTGKDDYKTALVIYVSGASELLLVPLDDDALTPMVGTRLMVLGVVMPQTGKVSVSKNRKRTFRLIRSHHTLSVP